MKNDKYKKIPTKNEMFISEIPKLDSLSVSPIEDNHSDIKTNRAGKIEKLYQRKFKKITQLLKAVPKQSIKSQGDIETIKNKEDYKEIGDTVSNINNAINKLKTRELPIISNQRKLGKTINEKELLDDIGELNKMLSNKTSSPKGFSITKKQQNRDLQDKKVINKSLTNRNEKETTKEEILIKEMKNSYENSKKNSGKIMKPTNSNIYEHNNMRFNTTRKSKNGNASLRIISEVRLDRKSVV